MRGVARQGRNKRGVTLALIVGTLFSMLALSALAIDLAMLRSTRSEAQRAADAVALAGASAYRDFPWTDAATTDEAADRAIKIARQNQVRLDTIDVRSPVSTSTTYGWGKVRVVQTAQLTLNLIPDSQKVRAWVRHDGVPTFFGGMLGVPYGHVQAMATAWATEDGPVPDCLKPFVIPDTWWESDKTDEDANDNNYMEPSTSGSGNSQDGESWKYEPASVGGQDYYLPYNPDVEDDPEHPQTGYGSGMRGGAGYPGDVGLPMLIKPQTGNGNGQSAPERMGNAFWLLDFDGDANAREEIQSGCAEAGVGDQVPYDNGGKTGQARQGVEYLINQDPGATWNQSTKQVENSSYSDWTRSPRVITIGIVSPDFWIANSKNTKPDPGSTFTNFARMFLLGTEGNDNIRAIFLGHSTGHAGGPKGGPLVKMLQLIE